MVHPKNIWGSGNSSTTPENIYPYLSLVTVLPAPKLPRNCYIMNIDSNFPTHHIYPAWKTILICWYKSKGTSEIPISQLFSELEKIWKCSVSYYSKIPIFILYHELGKNREVQVEQHSKIPIFDLFVDWKKLVSTAYQDSKVLVLNL